MTASEDTGKGKGRVVAFYLGATTVVPAVVFFAATLLVTDVRSGVRLAAGFLELLGIAAAGWGFAASRVRFGGRPPLLEPLVTPMKRGLGLASPTRHEVEDASATSAIATPEAKVTVRAGPDSTIERRVEILERRVEELDGMIDRTAASVREESEELREGLRAEKAVRRKAIQRVEELLADAATEGIGRVAVGFIWVGMGIAAETLVAIL